jgi:hypothetical protein
MSSPNVIIADVEGLLEDNGPDILQENPELRKEVAAQICRMFDYSQVCEQIDDLTAAILKHKGYPVHSSLEIF